MGVISVNNSVIIRSNGSRLLAPSGIDQGVVSLSVDNRPGAILSEIVCKLARPISAIHRGGYFVQHHPTQVYDLALMDHGGLTYNNSGFWVFTRPIGVSFDIEDVTWGNREDLAMHGEYGYGRPYLWSVYLPGTGGIGETAQFYSQGRITGDVATYSDVTLYGLRISTEFYQQDGTDDMYAYFRFPTKSAGILPRPLL